MLALEELVNRIDDALDSLGPEIPTRAGDAPGERSRPS